ncbi:hypothetical protein CYMTET_28887 [Cymbomonas tetramitiformis]|uniref:Uncharacterized protein n=1 Tax=Cymbomonas tetramitiformis TaxID=36881 RepID=A0AAE0FM32_9CHLO|nr:hypothetical protein CYMTET_28887 [Cymbomonas tetramitiformis]
MGEGEKVVEDSGGGSSCPERRKPEREEWWSGGGTGAEAIQGVVLAGVDCVGKAVATVEGSLGEAVAERKAGVDRVEVGEVKVEVVEVRVAGEKEAREEGEWRGGGGGLGGGGVGKAVREGVKAAVEEGHMGNLRLCPGFGCI